MASIKINDTVKVLTGKDRGKQGLVVDVSTKKGKVIVQGIAVVTKHAKARKQGEVSSIKKQETYVDASNVMLVCSSCKKPSRSNVKISEGQKVRICNRCEEVI